MKKIAGKVPTLWEKRGPEDVVANLYGLTLGTQGWTNPRSSQYESHSFFTKKSGFTVCPITKDGKLVLVRQFKQAANKICLEFPGGLPEAEEEPLVTVGRELREETGHAAVRIVETTLAPILIGPRKSPSGFRTFVALDCRYEGAQSLDAGEAAIEVVSVDQNEFWKLAQCGEIHAAETLTTALLAFLNGYLLTPKQL